MTTTRQPTTRPAVSGRSTLMRRSAWLSLPAVRLACAVLVAVLYVAAARPPRQRHARPITAQDRPARSW